MMKIFYLATLITVINTFAEAQDSILNFLKNSSFENVVNGSLPEYWNGDTKIYSTSPVSLSGNRSLEYTNNDSSVYKICTQELNIKPGLTYEAGVSIKTSDIKGKDSGASFCVEWFDKNGKWFGGVYPDGIKGTNNWTEIHSVISIPEDAKKVLFCCYVRKGMTGTAWFDNAYFQQYHLNKLNVLLLQPGYRETLFNESDSNIIFSVDLNNFNNELNGGYLFSTLKNTNGKISTSDLTNINSRESKYVVNMDAQQIPNGIYTLNVSLKSVNGNLIDSFQTSINKIDSAGYPRIYFDENKRLIENGKPVFPLGMYWGGITEQDLKKYSESKFNFILPYSPPDSQQLKLAEMYNIKVIYSVKDLYYGTQYAPKSIKNTEDEIHLLTETIRQFKNSPSLLAWYTNDEYKPDFMDRLNQHYNILSISGS